MRKDNCKFPKLDGKIVEVYGTRKAFAEALNVSQNTLTYKLNGKFPWKPREIDASCQLLGIDRADMPIYFFA